MTPSRPSKRSGAGVIAQLATRINVPCGVLCAPAALDSIEVSKAVAKMAEIEKDPAKYGYESALTEAAKLRSLAQLPHYIRSTYIIRSLPNLARLSAGSDR